MKNRNLARVLALVLVLCMGVMMLSACQKAPVEETAAQGARNQPPSGRNNRMEKNTYAV